MHRWFVIWTRAGVWDRSHRAVLDALAERGLLDVSSDLLMHEGDGDVAPGGGDRSETVASLKVLLPWMVVQGYHFDFPA